MCLLVVLFVISGIQICLLVTTLYMYFHRLIIKFVFIRIVMCLYTGNLSYIYVHIYGLHKIQIPFFKTT